MPVATLTGCLEAHGESMATKNPDPGFDVPPKSIVPWNPPATTRLPFGAAAMAEMVERRTPS